MKTKIRIVSQFCILALIVGALSLAGAARAADTTPTGERFVIKRKGQDLHEESREGRDDGSHDGKDG